MTYDEITPGQKVRIEVGPHKDEGIVKEKRRERYGDYEQERVWVATERWGMRICSPKVLVLLASLLLAMSACGEEARKDATTEGQKVDRSAPEVIAMPNRFRNIAHKCDGHGHRVYSNSTGDSGTGAQLFVIEDPSCPGGREVAK